MHNHSYHAEQLARQAHERMHQRDRRHNTLEFFIREERRARRRKRAR